MHRAVEVAVGRVVGNGCEDAEGVTEGVDLGGGEGVVDHGEFSSILDRGEFSFMRLSPRSSFEGIFRSTPAMLRQSSLTGGG